MGTRKALGFAAASGAIAFVTAAAAQNAPIDMAKAEARAAATVARMTVEEKAAITHGVMALPFFGNVKLPADAVLGAGYVPGVPRLDVPSLRETDASLGVAYIGGLRHDGATGLPSGLAQAATWNPDILRAGGAMIGSEARQGIQRIAGGRRQPDARSAQWAHLRVSFGRSAADRHAGWRGDQRDPIEPHHLDDQALRAQRAGNGPQGS